MVTRTLRGPSPSPRSAFKKCLVYGPLMALLTRRTLHSLPPESQPLLMNPKSRFIRNPVRKDTLRFSTFTICPGRLSGVLSVCL